MFREMRRKDKEKTYEEAVEILKAGSNGVLSVSGDDGYPYGVPVSYVFADDKVYFHCATEGHKLESIEKNPKVSFCVVGADNVASEKFTTIYKSVICFGKAKIVTENAEKQNILEKFIDKYSSEYREGGMKYIKSAFDGCRVVEISIEHMSAKGLEK